jgi:hypothetical protein
MVLWGVGQITQDTLLKAVVAGVLPQGRRSLAFGLYYAGYGLGCSSAPSPPGCTTSSRSDGGLPPGGSALGAVAEVHDTVAEPVFLQQLQLGAGVAGECGLALTDEHRTNEEVALIDLCRRPHRSIYADTAIMPTRVRRDRSSQGD